MKFLQKMIVFFSLLVLMALPVAYAKTFLKFSGGPSGGTYQYFSNGMAIRLSKKLTDVKVSNQASRGSVENIRKVNSGRVDFGIAYSGDCYLASKGLLTGDANEYTDVRAIAFLYKAPAQLAVLRGSGIKSVADLAGKKVALGGAGSGAAASSERYFKLTGLWDKIDRQFLGYSKAASALKDGHIDAMWVLAGYPTRALIELGASKDMDLLDVYEYGVQNGLKTKLPFYQHLIIPANVYEDVPESKSSFFDSALWIAHKDVDPAIVFKAMEDIYSADGLKYMVNVKSTAKQMSIKDGVVGIVTPLHKGAQKFWMSKGLMISGAAKAVE